MTRIYSIVSAALLVLLPVFCFTQTSQVFFESTSSEQGSQCYTINLQSMLTGDVLLSSQNFRMYYDASVLRFDRLRTHSLLPSKGYQDIKVMQAVHNSNAQGFGGLEFGSNLGYINLSLNDKMDKAQLLPVGLNTKIGLASICFEIMDPSREPALVWARDALTSGYSSAYTKIAVYKGEELKTIDDLEFIDIDASWTSHPDKMVDLGTTRIKR
ncbi:MAG: hypothetical protein ACI9FN_001458 [Saprospiraceae bacterium]|jgi:hypothetical protein